MSKSVSTQLLFNGDYQQPNYIVNCWCPSTGIPAAVSFIIIYSKSYTFLGGIKHHF